MPAFFIGVKLAGRWAARWKVAPYLPLAGQGEEPGVVIAAGCPAGGHDLSSKVCKACRTIDWPTYRRQREVDTHRVPVVYKPGDPRESLIKERHFGKRRNGYRATTVNWGYKEKRYLTIQIKGTRFSTRTKLEKFLERIPGSVPGQPVRLPRFSRDTRKRCRLVGNDT